MIGNLIAAIVIGFIAGFLGRALLPGPDPMGVVATIAVGIVGALVGWVLFTYVLGSATTTSSTSAASSARSSARCSSCWSSGPCAAARRPPYHAADKSPDLLRPPGAAGQLPGSPRSPSPKGQAALTEVGFPTPQSPRSPLWPRSHFPRSYGAA